MTMAPAFATDPAAPPDLVDQLRELEQTAKRADLTEVRSALIAAAVEIEHWRAIATTAAERLEEASRARIGTMDSQSRVDAVTRQVQGTLTQVAGDLRLKLAE
jgi:hypothetical protein